METTEVGLTELIGVCFCVVCDHSGFSVKSGDGAYFLVIIGKHLLDNREKTVTIRLQQYKDLPLDQAQGGKKLLTVAAKLHQDNAGEERQQPNRVSHVERDWILSADLTS